MVRACHRPRWRSALVTFGIGVLVVALQPAAAATEPAPLFPHGAAAYRVEGDGRVLWSHEADRPLPPASLTKVMTALLLLEHALPDDERITVSARAARATGARLGVQAGEHFRFDALLRAMLLRSANDACLALAEHLSGNETAFVAMMNARAQALGLGHTRFANACGHDAPGHRSSAADLAVLTRAALQQPRFASTVRTVRTTVASASGRRWTVENTNELIGRYPGAVGVKTGYTRAAGKCLIVLAQRDNATVLLVVLGAADRWWDTAAALDRAFDLALATRPLPAR